MFPEVFSMENEFQYRLQKAIAAKKITASELSRLSGVGKSDISNYVNGKYLAKQEKVLALARALDVDPGWLMTGEEPVHKERKMPIVVPDSEMFVKITSHMSAADYRMVMEAFDRTYKKMQEEGLV